MVFSKKSCVRCAFLCALLLFTSCDDKKQSKQMPLQMVGAVKVVKKNVPMTIEAPARIAGSLEVQVRAQIGGILKSRVYTEGQYIREGEKLFEIDQEPYRAALLRAQGTLAQAESELKRTTRDYERMSKLHKAGAISQKEHDDSLAAFEHATANLKVAEGSVREAEINLGYTEVKAPISGIVRKEAQSVGSLIALGGDASLLTSMVRVCPLHAEFSLSGSVWNKITKNRMSGKLKVDADDLKVQVVMSDGSVYPYLGRIIFIDSTEDDMTSSVSIKAEIPSTEDQKLLIPGQFVRVRLIGAEYSNALVVPASALVTTANGNLVYTVGKDKIVKANSVTSEFVGGDVVIDKGISEDDVVITEGISKVRPGNPVNAVLKAGESENSKSAKKSDKK